jgi:hypothetical protein
MDQVQGVAHRATHRLDRRPCSRTRCTPFSYLKRLYLHQVAENTRRPLTDVEVRRVIEIAAVVIIFSFAKHVGPAVRRLGRQLCHAGVAVIRHTTRLILGASLPAGAVILELHRDGSV